MQSVIDVPDHRGKGIFIGSRPIAVPGTTWATKAGMKYIHDEWKEGMPARIRRYLIAGKSAAINNGI